MKRTSLYFIFILHCFGKKNLFFFILKDIIINKKKIHVTIVQITHCKLSKNILYNVARTAFHPKK